MSWNCAMPRTLIAAVSICLLASAAHAGDQGDPAQSCDGSTMEMVKSPVSILSKRKRL